MQQIGIKYGVVCAVFLLMAFVISYFLGIHPFVEISHMFFDVVLFGLMIFLGVSELRKNQPNGELHFWQGMTIGFWVYGFAIVAYSVALWLFMEINSEVLESYKTSAMSYLNEKSDMYIDQFGEDQFEIQKNNIAGTSNGSLILSGAVKKFVSGLFVTPVISLFLRRKSL